MLTFLWSGPLTGTGGQVEETFSSTLNSLTGKDAVGDDPPTRPTPSSEAQSRAPKSGWRTTGMRRSRAQRKVARRREQYPLSEVDKYHTPVVPLEELPVTALGNAAGQLGINVSMINRLLRGGAPLMLQLFVGLGFLLVLLGRVRRFSPSPEFFTGAAGCLGRHHLARPVARRVSRLRHPAHVRSGTFLARTVSSSR